jgi:hypothetical protein
MDVRTVVGFVLLFAAASSAADDADRAAIAAYRAGLLSIVRHVESLPEAATRVPSRAERDDARLLWRSFQDYQLALESIRGANRDAFRLDHGAWLAQYRTALAFIEAVDRHPEYHTLLNETDPTLGLVSGSYADFKLRWLNVARAAEFTAFAVLDATRGGTPVPSAADDARFLVAAGVGAGAKQTLRNAARIAQGAMWTPIPQTIARLGGGPEKPAPRPSFVSGDQIAALRRRLQPGDLIFERRDWALTNVGLPGFWPHVAMYVGTPDERRRIFGDDFERRLRARDPQQYDARFAAATVVEAIGEGVVTSTFEHSADADSVAVVRPLLEPGPIGEAIARAFAYVGRPYDFEFDFVTDDRIVCTELVYKAYEGALALPVMRMAGRSVSPANDYVRWFDEQYDGRRALDFVGFLDGYLRTRSATDADVAAFRKSWKRPRWHAMTAKP